MPRPWGRAEPGLVEEQEGGLCSWGRGRSGGQGGGRAGRGIREDLHLSLKGGGSPGGLAVCGHSGNKTRLGVHSHFSPLCCSVAALQGGRGTPSPAATFTRSWTEERGRGTTPFCSPTVWHTQRQLQGDDLGIIRHSAQTLPSPSSAPRAASRRGGNGPGRAWRSLPCSSAPHPRRPTLHADPLSGTAWLCGQKHRMPPPGSCLGSA